jgi:DNA-binding CsgD family transcriptional regulator
LSAVAARPDAETAGSARAGSEGLLDRDDVLRSIDQALDSASDRASLALLLVGHAGMGKTRLFEAALGRARERRFRVVRAGGAELEQNLAFGLAAQLLRSLLSEVPPAQREALSAAAPKRVLSLERSNDGNPEDDDHLAVSHAVFNVLATGLEDTPALIAIDDLQWSDSASIGLLLYVLHRLDELPVALVMTRRPPSDESPTDPLSHLGVHPKVQVEPLAPLRREAIAALIAQVLGPDVDPALAEVCRDATAGNPFFVQELLRALAEEPDRSSGRLLARARTLVPDAVGRSLRVRVGRLGPDAAALARTVAVLGDDVPLRHAAVLSDLSVAQASLAADSLSAANVLLAREPLKFVHPLVRQAIEQDIAASEVASRHLDAARLLYGEGEGVELVAAHLLLGRAEGDPWVVERLQAAAREARSSGAPQSAVRYLERALAEPPSREQRPQVLGELGAAEAVLGLPAAPEHLAAASAETADPRHRAELALELGRVYDAHGDHARAARTFEAGLRDLNSDPAQPGDRELCDQLQAGFIASGTLVPALRPRAAASAARWLRDLPALPATQGERLLLAHVALEGAHRGEPAERIIDFAERAWDDGRILREATSQWIGWRLVANALCSAGALERSDEIAEAAIQDARRRNSPLGFATACFIRSSARMGQGQINDALADLESVRDGRRYGWAQFLGGAAAKYALCLLETGEIDAAEAALSEDAPLREPYDLEDAMRLVALAEVRRAQGRLDEALAAAQAAGAAAEATIPFFDYCRWRTSAAQAALGLGDQAQALGLAAEMLERAEQTQVVEHRIEALRVSGICRGGPEGLAQLQAAAELGRGSPPRLETLRSLVDLGAALRRSGERAACRAPLQEAADRARQCGARLLYDRARTELAASGARPRRELLLSGPGSLTPSERRIAELAAGGQSNREIATMLFVTPKTVEYHLRNAYRKLDIQTRRELGEALSG